VLSYWAGGFSAIFLAIFGADAIGTFSIILFIAALGAAVVHTNIQNGYDSGGEGGLAAR